MIDQILPLPKFTLKEKEITHNIRAYLRIKRVWHYKQHQGLGSEPGIPDIVGIWKGKYLGIEVKTAKGLVSDIQKAVLERINSEGGLAFVARSVEEVIERLEK